MEWQKSANPFALCMISEYEKWNFVSLPNMRNHAMHTQQIRETKCAFSPNMWNCLKCNISAKLKSKIIWNVIGINQDADVFVGKNSLDKKSHANLSLRDDRKKGKYRLHLSIFKCYNDYTCWITEIATRQTFFGCIVIMCLISTSTKV